MFEWIGVLFSSDSLSDERQKRRRRRRGGFRCGGLKTELDKNDNAFETWWE
jgi:hypothetical protein